MASMFKAALAATAMTVLGGMSAQAVPSFVNPSFLQGQVTQAAGSSGYQGGSNGTATGWASTSTQGAIGVSGMSTANSAVQWDNGTPAAGTSNVEFFQIAGNGLQQTVSGFVVGHTYTFSIQATIRAATQGAPKLGITVNGVDYSNGGITIGQADAMATYAKPWGNYTSLSFTATSTSALIAFLNDGGSVTDETIDVANATIQDTTVASAVPEPASLVLLAVGLAGVAVVRRRGATSV